RHPRFVLLVAFGVTEVGQHHGDGRRTRTFKRVDPKEQLYEVVIGREDGRLHQVDVASTNVLTNPDEEITLRELDDLTATGCDAKLITDCGRELRARRAAEHQNVVTNHHCPPAHVPTTPPILAHPLRRGT